MNDKDWLVLKVLKESKSISNAADKLFISQPALSKRIHVLEDELQTRIIVRTKNGIEFTSTGEFLYQYAVEMTARFQELKDSLHEMQDTRYVLRIGVTPAFSQFVLPNVLKNFSLLNTNVYPIVRSGYSCYIFEWLKTGEIQLGFLRNDCSIEGYENYCIGSIPLCLISKNAIEIHDLPMSLRIAYDTDPSLLRQIDYWEKNIFGQANKLKVGMHVSDGQTCIRMVSQGMGYAIVPYYFLSHQAIESLWINLLKDNSGHTIMRSTYFIYNQHEYLTSKPINLFINFIKEYFPSYSNWNNTF